MFKGALRAFKDFNTSRNSLNHDDSSTNRTQSFASSDDLSEPSEGQSRVQSTFFGEDLRIPSPKAPPRSHEVDKVGSAIHPEDSEHTTDSRRAKIREWDDSKEGESLPPSDKATITASFLVPPFDDEISPRTTDDSEHDLGVTAPSNLPSSVNIKLDRLLKLSAQHIDFFENKLEDDEKRASPMDVDLPYSTPDSQEETPSRKPIRGFLNPFSEGSPPFSAVKRDVDSPSPRSTGNGSSPLNKNSPSPSTDNSAAMAELMAATFRRKVVELTTSECPPFTTSASQPLPNAAKDVPSDDTEPRNPKSSDPSSPQDQEPRDTGRKPPRKRKDNLFAMLQPIVESSTTFTPKSSASPPPFGSSLYGVDSTFAKKMEEAGRLRRLQSQSHIDLKADNKSPTTSPPPPPLLKHARSRSGDTPPPPSRPVPNTPLENVSNTLHKETRSPKSPPPIPPKVLPKPSPFVPHIDHEAISRAAEVQGLRDQLARAMRETKAFETELARVTTQSTNDRERLARELKTAKQDNVVLVDQVKLITQRNDEATSEMKRAQADLRKLTVEKRGWQEQLDTMHHKVVQAERQIRCLDHITRAKLEAREETTFGSTKRTKLAMTQQQQPSSELIKAFKDLNEEILQAANLLVENLDRTHYHLSTTELSGKAEKIVGTHVTQMLKAQAVASKNAGFGQLLMMVVLEVFFVHWCSAIIEGFYPKRTTFADLLVELSSQTTVVTAAGCGKQLRVVETQSTATVQFPTWASEIIRDLSDVLLIGGLKIRAQRQAVFTTKIQSIITLAYDLRAALAEKDICGGVELVVESPDLPFQPKWMEEAYTTDRRGTSTMLTQMEPIAGTTGMGLKRTNVGGTQNDAQTYLLKPKVVLARVLRESP